MHKQMKIEDVLPGMVISRHGYNWKVLANDLDPYGDRSGEAPAPRQIVTVNPLGTAPANYAGAQFGFKPGEAVTAADGVAAMSYRPRAHGLGGVA